MGTENEKLGIEKKNLQQDNSKLKKDLDTGQLEANLSEHMLIPGRKEYEGIFEERSRPES